jgi:GTPase SAR1 family protein
MKQYQDGEVAITLKIWDTPGAAEFGPGTKDIDYANADIVILVYSIDKHSTFD